jgi:hypothetical protein
MVDDQQIINSHGEEKTNMLDYIIISHENPLYNSWSLIHTLSSLSSSYFYAYMAAFQFGKGLETIDWIYEIIFFISFGLNFIVDYKIEG